VKFLIFMGNFFLGLNFIPKPRLKICILDCYIHIIFFFLLSGETLIITFCLFSQEKIKVHDDLV
jgi:hypothetical protein